MRLRTFDGAQLRAARKAQGLSQSRLAGKIGAHVTSLSDWERGKNAPSARHVASLARELKVEVGHFFDDSDDDEESDPVAALMAAITRFVDHRVKARS